MGRGKGDSSLETKLEPHLTGLIQSQYMSQHAQHSKYHSSPYV